MPMYYPTFTSRIDGRKVENIPKDISRFDGYKEAPMRTAISSFNRRRVITIRRPYMSSWYNLLGLALIPIRRTVAASIPLTDGSVDFPTVNTNVDGNVGQMGFGIYIAIAIGVLITLGAVSSILTYFKIWFFCGSESDEEFEEMQQLLAETSSSFAVDLEARECGPPERKLYPYFAPLSSPVIEERSFQLGQTPSSRVIEQVTISNL